MEHFYFASSNRLYTFVTRPCARQASKGRPEKMSEMQLFFQRQRQKPSPCPAGSVCMSVCACCVFTFGEFSAWRRRQATPPKNRPFSKSRACERTLSRACEEQFLPRLGASVTLNKRLSRSQAFIALPSTSRKVSRRTNKTYFITMTDVSAKT